MITSFLYITIYAVYAYEYILDGFHAEPSPY